MEIIGTELRLQSRSMIQFQCSNCDTRTGTFLSGWPNVQPNVVPLWVQCASPVLCLLLCEAATFVDLQPVNTIGVKHNKWFIPADRQGAGMTSMAKAQFQSEVSQGCLFKEVTIPVLKTLIRNRRETQRKHW